MNRVKVAIALACSLPACSAGKPETAAPLLVVSAPTEWARFRLEMQNRYDELSALILTEDLEGLSDFYAADPLVDSAIRPHLAAFFEDNRAQHRTILRLSYTVKCVADRPGYRIVDYIQREKDVWRDGTREHSEDYVQQEQGKWAQRDGRWVTIDTKSIGPDLVSVDGGPTQLQPNGIPLTSDRAC